MCIFSSLFFSISFGVEIPRLNNIVTIKQGEINEIKIYRENIKDIDDKYSNLIIDILEKDYEIYHSTENMNMSEYEAINLMKNYGHIAFQLFKDFVMASDSKYFIYVDYDILHEFQNKFLELWWSEQQISERTWKIIFFEILISENDNITEYLYKRTPWGEFNLNNYQENESQFGTSNLLNLINETRASNIFWYNKTWEILYNYSQYGIININVDIPLYDRIVQIYYENPILEMQNKIMNYNINLAVSSSSVIFLTFLLDILKRKVTSKKIKEEGKKSDVLKKIEKS
ncbi:MAG: hypothetical protein E3J90_06570 [Promethearchaeota archaeon]|nr:MAG: hypothetical protein E3J90_06570 [Candidatus Lokiarchaeota archaeon]